MRPHVLLLLTVLGLVSLWRGILAYLDHLDRREEALAARSPEGLQMPFEDAVVAIEKHHGFITSRQPAAGPPK